jgi:hypothetical protein
MITAIEKGDVPPSRAILMAMRMHWRNMECITQFSMIRASLEATGHHHRVIITPAAARATINKTTMQNVLMLLAVLMAIAMWQYDTACIARRRRFMAFIKATKC